MSRQNLPLRSLLFAPGNHARRVEKALSLDADAVILDLEDAVAVAEKPTTRAAIAATLERPRCGLLYVCVNAIHTNFCYGDLVGVVQAGLDSIVLLKAETAAGTATIDWVLGQLELDRNLPHGAIDLIPIIDTARGLRQIDAILSAGHRVRRVAFAAGNFTLDPNMAWTRNEAELARAQVVTASRAARCRLVGRPELANDPRCATMRSRAAHAGELLPELRAALAERTALEWEEIVGEHVPCAAVRPIEAMFDHPQVLAGNLVTTLDHPVVGRYRAMTKPVVFSETPGPAPTASPRFGQHSDEVLAAHGFSNDEIAAFRARGVVC